MDLKTLRQHFQTLPQLERTADLLQYDKARVQWKNLVGSARSLTSIALAQQVRGHHLFLLNDKEDAAYFLNDLQGLFPNDDRIVFFPASYKTPYKLEETDNANVVGRAEVLDKLTKSQNMWIVSYP